MKIMIKNIFGLVVVLALGIATGNGVQHVRDQIDVRRSASGAGDYSTLIGQGDAPVVLFGTSTCPYCKQARAYLDQHGIRYRDIDVQTADGNALFSQYQGNGVPLLLTANMRLQGFLEPQYDKHVLPLAKRG
jgi:mycoredoxin